MNPILYSILGHQSIRIDPAKGFMSARICHRCGSRWPEIMIPPAPPCPPPKQDAPTKTAEAPIFSKAEITDLINRRARIEQKLFDIANGKADWPDRETVRKWALELGTPGYQHES